MTQIKTNDERRYPGHTHQSFLFKKEGKINSDKKTRRLRQTGAAKPRGFNGVLSESLYQIFLI